MEMGHLIMYSHLTGTFFSHFSCRTLPSSTRPMWCSCTCWSGSWWTARRPKRLNYRRRCWPVSICPTRTWATRLATRWNPSWWRIPRTSSGIGEFIGEWWDVPGSSWCIILALVSFQDFLLDFHSLFHVCTFLAELYWNTYVTIRDSFLARFLSIMTVEYLRFWEVFHYRAKQCPWLTFHTNLNRLMWLIYWLRSK